MPNDATYYKLVFLASVLGFAVVGTILILMLMHHQRWRFSLSLLLVLLTLVAVGMWAWGVAWRMSETPLAAIFF
jgi:hypothetical protein